MLDPKNDNLHDADGNQENTDNQELETSKEVTEKVEEKVNVNDNQKVIDEIDSSNAEESEDETLSERHDIPMLDYESMPMEALVSELEKLVSTGKVSSIKEHIEEIRKEFTSKYNEFIDEKREQFASENEGDTTGFEYHLPVKQKFDSLLDDYKERKSNHYKTLENNLKANLKIRLEIIEELKSLIDPEMNIPDLFKQFNEIREKWRSAGAIPKDKYNHVWNNYHFHIENFYDYIHLDREARDMDFKYNLEQKQKIITRAKELVNEPDLNKAFRELQLLHKLWKEELGPVSREHREEIWSEFSAVTRQIHDRRENYYQELRAKEEENFVAKQNVINQISAIANENTETHSQWQRQIKKIETLRNEFFAIGKAPVEKRDQIWKEFREATKDFNFKKNTFYRNMKAEQQENLSKKQTLLDKAIELKDSEDFEKITPVMKQIQAEWKTIGHVPRKVSDEIWKQFKNACNHYFDRLHAKRNEENEAEAEAYEKKKEYLENLKNTELTGEYKTDLELIKSHIEAWKSLGRVAHSKRHIEGKYNKVLDILFDKLSLSKKDADAMRYNNRISGLVEANDERKLNSERIFLSRKIDEIQNHILQLENNMMFITGATDKNPLVVEVNKNIERHKQELQDWKDKLAQLNQAIRQGKQTEVENTSEEDNTEDKENEA
ncbi:MAG: DUF349 domain-containing protein [Flavobacteriaceae bacterium]